MFWACGMYGREKDLKERDNIKDIGIYGKVIITYLYTCMYTYILRKRMGGCALD
jgi:hypothetical protein